MKIRFVGDIHSRFGAYINMIKGCERSIQVGDYGVGFEDQDYNPLPILPLNHQFIRGNHDYPAGCKLQPNWIEDGTFKDGMFFVGGAYSVDMKQRIDGYDWWQDEELSVTELNSIIDKYEQCKPDVIVSHDVARSYLPPFVRDKIESRTSQAFDAMFEIHQPKLWVFGHYHQDFDFEVNGTRFVCVNKMSFKDIEI